MEPESAQPIEPMSRRRAMVKIGEILLGGAALATDVTKLNHSPAVLPVLDVARQLSSEDSPTHELETLIHNLNQAKNACWEFIAKNESGFAINVVYPHLEGNYADIFLKYVYMHGIVLNRALERIQALIQDTGLVSTLSRPELALYTARVLYNNAVDELHLTGANVDVAEDIVPTEFLEMSILLNFWCNKNRAERKVVCPSVQPITGFTEEETQRITQIVTAIEQQIPSCATIEKADVGEGYFYKPPTNSIELENLELFGSIGEKWNDLQSVALVAHERAHSADLTVNPWLFEYLTVEEYEELCSLRWEAVREGFKGYYMTDLDVTDWFVCHYNGRTDIPSIKNGLYANENWIQRDEGFFDLFYNKLVFPDVSSVDELENRAKEIVDDEHTDVLIPKLLARYRDNIARAFDARRLHIRGALDTSPFGSAIEVRDIINHFLVKSLIDGVDVGVYNLADKDTVAAKAKSLLVYEREHFPEVVSCWTAMQQTDLPIPPNRDEIVSALERMPDIKYIRRLRQVIGDDAMTSLATRHVV